MCRRFTIASLTLLALVMPALAQEDVAKPPPEPAGMEKLFNGKDLTGWDGDPRLWSVKDGVIRGETTRDNPAKGNTFLVCKAAPAGDFDLRLSFRCTASNNSGVQYRSKHITEGKLANAWVVRGYQAEIRNETDLPNVAGFIYDEGGKRGRMCLVGERVVWKDGKKNVTGQTCTPQEYKKAFHLDGWNDYVIVAKGNRIRQYLNALLTADFTDEEPQLALKSGIIALQLHAGNPMRAEFRDVRLKREDGK
jgi:hypothetical protein